MQGITQVRAGSGLLFTRALLAAAVRLFSKRDSTSEGFLEQRVEEKWDADYRRVDKINFTAIFSSRLSNYVRSGSTVSTEHEELTLLLKKVMSQAKKWCPMAFGIGRVFLMPYIIGDRIYVDIIPQSKEISLDVIGDEIHGFVAISDIRNVGKNKYARLTHYRYDHELKTFEISNKAVRWDNGAEVALNTVSEWAKIDPYMVLTGIEKPLFAVIDCPQDNRDGDKPQGASITYGCDGIIAEIYECLAQYQIEYRHKVSVLGIDQAALDKQNNVSYLPREYIKVNGTGGMEAGDLFSVYSPEIRSQAYRDRLLELFGLLEKQVGTSKGILTPAETSQATATEVKRTMYDTRALVNAMRESIETGFENLAYGLTVMLELAGRRVTGDYHLTWDWSDEMTTDPQEEFSEMTQLHSAKVVSDVELRRLKYPNETPEEAQKVIDEIKASQPDPFEEMFPVEPFGGSDKEDQGGGGNE